ncbi:hypothetical protein M2651_00660 [Clostridium sp. SYSU_GA19001]|uniref:hypothetical protein n=1 Tax=Clostridium caldaquaticum TaxID=2940653 RepID=UPI0020772224|nr:hypothetical protein [Clostridium caldaquaticum]MCM8709532.1 hypothetical protein [Clostridium caldaquaticum]
MIRTFIASFKVSFAENANTFIHFLKRVPLIGKKIPDSLYKETGAKLFVGIVSQIFSIFAAIFKKALYLGIMLVLPAFLMSEKTGGFLAKFLHMFFFLNIIYGSIMNNVIFNYADKSAFNMITLMRADAREYYVSAMLYKYITNFIYFILPMIITGLIVKFSPLKALTLLLFLTCFKFIGEYLNIFIYNKKVMVLQKQNVFVTVFIFITLALAYGLPFFDLTLKLENVFFNVFIVLIVLCLGIGSLIYLWNYKKYTPIAKELLTKENMFDINKFESDMTFADVKLDEKKLSKEVLSSKAYEKKEGYEYLNAIFFSRHRKMLVNPIKLRVIIIAVLFIAVSILIILVPNVREKISKDILIIAPALVFIMYIMSTGERICKVMFYNCDVSLLRYSYYREPKVILSNFKARLKFTVGLNIIPALVLCISIAGILLLTGASNKLISAIPLFLCVLCLACFFSIHNLFMYYVIQPYTAQLIVKSPLYKFVNFIVYMVSYGCLNIKTSSYIFTAGVIAVTLIYIVIVLIVTYRVAPKTFRLK